MLNKGNIMQIIDEHQKEIEQLEWELDQAMRLRMEASVKSLSNRLSYLRDNQYRYKLQARAWKLNVDLD